MSLESLPLDRGNVESMGDQRAGFDFGALSEGSWRGYLVDRQARVAVEDSFKPGAHAALYTAPSAVDPEPILLGRTGDGLVHVAWVVDEEPSGAQFRPLIQVADQLSDDESLLAAQAVALARWHAQNRFCTRCGGVVESSEAGWANICTSCGAVEYPRTDPVVIVRITDDVDRLLLAHNTLWEPRRVSLLAGFVEAGESPRRAVQREVFEEVGLRVDGITYLGSQYWPGPRSLMLAFEAHPVGPDAQIAVDGEEIDEARFFTRAELTKALAEDEVRGPGPSSIAAAAISQWLGQDIQELMGLASARIGAQQVERHIS